MKNTPNTFCRHGCVLCFVYQPFSSQNISKTCQSIQFNLAAPRKELICFRSGSKNPGDEPRVVRAIGLLSSSAFFFSHELLHFAIKKLWHMYHAVTCLCCVSMLMQIQSQCRFFSYNLLQRAFPRVVASELEHSKTTNDYTISNSLQIVTTSVAQSRLFHVLCSGMAEREKKKKVSN